MFLVYASFPRSIPAQGVPAGVSFLSTGQSPTGAWGNPQRTSFRDTTAVVDTLAPLAQTGGEYQRGVVALENALVANSDYLGRQIVSLDGAGIDVSALTTRLLNAQDAESFDFTLPNFPGGGWGIGPKFSSDTLDTALALEALRTVGLGGGLSVVNNVVVLGTPQMHTFNVPPGASSLQLLVRTLTGQVRLTVGFPSGGTGSVDIDETGVPVIFNVGIETGQYTLTLSSLLGSPNTYSLEARFIDAGGFDVGRITRALSYLGFAQNPDGGFGVARGEDSQTLATLHALMTLQAHREFFDPDSAIANGVNWLLNTRRNPDGGFGGDPGTSTVDETALAAFLLQSVAPTSPELGAARAVLATTQLVNGSWNNDPYQTALALRALVPTALGDVSCESSLNSIDGLFVLQHDVGLRPASNLCPPPAGSLYLPQCDVNGDGQCNSIDGLFILQCDVGINNVLCP